MRVALMVEGNEDVSWSQWLDLATCCEGLRLDGLFRSDHYLSVFEPDTRGATDAWTTVAALAARTRRLRLGVLVSPVGFRHPSTLARIAATIDHVSAGRVEIGLGAGWYREEHDRHGFPFPDARTRFDQLEEQLTILDGLLRSQPFSFTGTHYGVDGCTLLPVTVQRPRPPLIVGGTAAPRGVRLAAAFAQEFNSDQGTPDECRDRFARVRREAIASVDRRAA